jgi:YidC/Oxa1 family membrane protein insertase
LFDQLIVQPLVQVLIFLNEVASVLPLPDAISSWAIALILVAVLVKVVTFPLTVNQMRSMKAMQRLQPKLKELQKRHKDDREKLAQAQMELYKEHGVNPLGGCLPLLIQMPVLFGLFYAIRQLSNVEMLGEQFLWIPNLALPEPLPNGDPAGIPFLIMLMVVSQFAYQKFATPPSADPQAQAMASATKFMPLMFVVFFIRFPAGLVLYYTSFNVVSLVQQWFLNRGTALDPGVPVADGAGADSSPKSPPDEAPVKEPTSHDKAKRRRRRRKKSR